MQLWLPILLSAVFVFIASSILNMVLSFWHRPDYRGFGNEDEVLAALRKGMTGPGMYMAPYCTPEHMKDPDIQQKFATGPLVNAAIKAGGTMSIGKSLLQWFVFCLGVSLLCALITVHSLPVGAPFSQVFCVIGIAALLGHAAGPFPNAIWWSHPWVTSFKHVIDGVLYALIVAATFAWLWPH
ncbi:MAG: hypothetical protein ABJB01_00985 [Rudaea sp.]